MSSQSVPGSQPSNPSRVKIYTSVVLALIPARVRVESAELPTGKISYLRYGHSVKGGNVFVHVHSDNPEQFKGRQITACCELWKHANADGTVELHIDLYPTTATPARHRLCVTNGTTPQRFRRGQRFAVPEPKQGQVI